MSIVAVGYNICYTGLHIKVFDLVKCQESDMRKALIESITDWINSSADNQVQWLASLLSSSNVLTAEQQAHVVVSPSTLNLINELQSFMSSEVPNNIQLRFDNTGGVFITLLDVSSDQYLDLLYNTLGVKRVKSLVFNDNHLISHPLEIVSLFPDSTYTDDGWLKAAIAYYHQAGNADTMSKVEIRLANPNEDLRTRLKYAPNKGKRLMQALVGFMIDSQDQEEMACEPLEEAPPEGRGRGVSTDSSSLKGEIDKVDGSLIRARVTDEGRIVLAISKQRIKTKYGMKAGRSCDCVCGLCRN